MWTLPWSDRLGNHWYHTSKLNGVTGASRISSVISGLTTGEVRGMSTDVEAMDTPTEDTAVAAAIDTPLPPDTRNDATIRLLCFPTVYFW